MDLNPKGEIVSHRYTGWVIWRWRVKVVSFLNFAVHWCGNTCGATYCMRKSSEVFHKDKKKASLYKRDRFNHESAAQVTSLTTVETESISDSYFCEGESGFRSDNVSALTDFLTLCKLGCMFWVPRYYIVGL